MGVEFVVVMVSVEVNDGVAAWGVKKAVMPEGVLGRLSVTGAGFPLTKVTVIV